MSRYSKQTNSRICFLQILVCMCKQTEQVHQCRFLHVDKGYCRIHLSPLKYRNTILKRTFVFWSSCVYWLNISNLLWKFPWFLSIMYARVYIIRNVSYKTTFCVFVIWRITIKCGYVLFFCGRVSDSYRLFQINRKHEVAQAQSTLKCCFYTNCT